MPYIKQERKKEIGVIVKELIRTPGELNYCLTKVCISYLKARFEIYSDYNDVIGALECCKLELYRRKIAKYEDKKIEENGDVY